MIRLIIRAILAAAVFIMAAVSFSCGNSAGSFHVSISWEDGVVPAKDKPFYIKAKLFSKAEDGTSEFLTGTDIIQMGDNITLNFKELSYGSSRFVRVEVRGDESEDSPVIFFGRSDVFDLAERSIVKVKLSLGMRPAPGIGKDGDTECCQPKAFAVADGIATDTVASSKIMPRVSIPLPQYVDTLTISNTSEALTGKISAYIRSYTIAELEPYKVNETDYDLPDEWDLDLGIPETVLTENTRSLFVTVASNEGYTSIQSVTALNIVSGR